MSRFPPPEIQVVAVGLIVLLLILAAVMAKSSKDDPWL